MARLRIPNASKVLHKLVVGTTATRGTDPTNNNFLLVHSIDDQDMACRDIAQHRVVFLGEIHSQPPIIAFQEQIQRCMVQNVVRYSSSKQPQRQNSCNIEKQECSNGSSSSRGGGGDSAPPNPPHRPPKLHVILEHFSFDMQPLLDRYQSGAMDFEQLVQEYNDAGTENHNLLPYRDLLDYARSHSQVVQLHAGFLPRSVARMVVADRGRPEKRAYVAAAQWLPRFNADRTVRRRQQQCTVRALPGDLPGPIAQGRGHGAPDQ
jgi:Haem-binding uptake, Tiki superfamily, ChaN